MKEVEPKIYFNMEILISGPCVIQPVFSVIIFTHFIPFSFDQILSSSTCKIPSYPHFADTFRNLHFCWDSTLGGECDQAYTHVQALER